MLALPDLLNRKPFLAVDEEMVHDLLGMAFIGKSGTAIDDTLSAAHVPEGPWNPEFYADDLFVGDLIGECFRLEIGGTTYPVNRKYLHEAFVHVPTDLETIRFRQEIVLELEMNDEIRANSYQLYRSLFALMSLLKTPGYAATLDVSAFHLDVLKQARTLIDFMVTGFASAHSGLHRLHDAGSEIQGSAEYRKLTDLLKYEDHLARLRVDMTIGGGGRIRHFDVLTMSENRANPFYRNPFRRFFDRCRLLFNGYEFSNRELMNRLVNTVFAELSKSLVPMIQLVGHLEFYLTNLSFKALAESRGLRVSLADFEHDDVVELDELFNPLLLSQETAPVPCNIRLGRREPILVVTGPNSGGKTRLLQAIGLSQLLGHSGLYTPSSSARLQVAHGLFVSLVEDESADQTEGRLGRELVRIRSLFEEMDVGSMVILDELCSGTNPSEGIELFALVLKLLRQVEPIAFVTTHFLDFARSLQNDPDFPDLEFLQVEIDDKQISTYQFIPGVAATSLASLTAKRLGVTFERLSAMIAEPARSERS